MASIARRDETTAAGAPATGTRTAKNTRATSPAKIDAQLWLDSVTASVRTGTYVSPRSSLIILANGRDAGC